MVKLLLDEGLPFRSARLLRELGIDAKHAKEAGLASAPDPVLLDFARQDGRACVTLDHDFHQLLAETTASQPSVILIREQGLDYERLADLLLRLVVRLGADLEKGVAVTATMRGVRIRRLPLK